MSSHTLRCLRRLDQHGHLVGGLREVSCPDLTGRRRSFVGGVQRGLVMCRSIKRGSNAVLAWRRHGIDTSKPYGSCSLSRPRRHQGSKVLRSERLIGVTVRPNRKRFGQASRSAAQVAFLRAVGFVHQGDDVAAVVQAAPFSCFVASPNLKIVVMMILRTSCASSCCSFSRVSAFSRLGMSAPVNVPVI